MSDIPDTDTREIERLRKERDEAIVILAHTDIGSLPNDWTLKDVAKARIDDLLKLRDQVRDTCKRAEAAERERIPPLPGLKGRTYICKDSDGQWYYLNHARTWQEYQGPEAARNKGNRLDVSGLRSLPSDWDSYGAPPISEHALAVAEAIHAVPMSDGGIMIEGHGGGGSLEIAINASGCVELVSWEPAALDQKEKG